MTIIDMFNIEHTLTKTISKYNDTMIMDTHTENGFTVTRTYSSEFALEMEYGSPFMYDVDDYKKVLAFYKN